MDLRMKFVRVALDVKDRLQEVYAVRPEPMDVQMFDILWCFLFAMIVLLGCQGYPGMYLDVANDICRILPGVDSAA